MTVSKQTNRPVSDAVSSALAASFASRLGDLASIPNLRVPFLFVIMVAMILILTVRSVPARALKSGAEEQSYTVRDTRLRAPGLPAGAPAPEAADTASPIAAPTGLDSRVRVKPGPLGTLMAQLRDDHSYSERLTAMTALERMPDAVPALIAGLASPDPAVRIACSEVLGWQSNSDAVEALLQATFDPDARVREAAVTALGEIGALVALPRVQQLQIVQGNFYIQSAAYIAEQRIMALVAQELRLGSSELHAISVAPLTGWAYAVTSRGLAARRAGTWRFLNNLPDSLTGVLATSADGQFVMVAGDPGLYISADGADTWRLTEAELLRDPSIRITAAVINPLDSRQAFIGIAAALPSSNVPAKSIGVYGTLDGGETWRYLPGSPRENVTIRLSLDVSASRFLFGATGFGVWRYRFEDTDSILNR